jgi:sulfatase modifying factor 1
MVALNKTYRKTLTPDRSAQKKRRGTVLVVLASLVLIGGGLFYVARRQGVKAQPRPSVPHVVSSPEQGVPVQPPPVVPATSPQAVSTDRKSEPHPGANMSVQLGGGNVRMEFVWVKALNGWVGKYEVTNEEYRKFKADHKSGEYSGHRLNADRQPVVQVSYNEAVAFGEWVNRTATLPEGYKARLPDGKEWLTFAQCGDGREYPWGKNWPPPNNWNYHGQEGAGSWEKISGHNDGHPVTCPVENSGVNDWGLYGVGGNVWEWTSELYDSTHDARVLRGASWYFNDQVTLRCSFRDGYFPSFRYYIIGFRLVVLAPRAVTPGWEAEPIEATRDHPFASETKRVPQHAPGSFRFELAEGSTVTGKPSFPSIVVTLSFGDITMLIDQIVAVQFSEEDPTAQIELRNGDTVKGKVKLGAFTVDVKGKTIPVDGSQVRSIRCP